MAGLPLRRRVLSYTVGLLGLAVYLGGIGCSSDDTAAERDDAPVESSSTAAAASAAPNSDIDDADTESTESTVDMGPCVLTNEEVGSVINDAITQVLPQGNWGIASTCTYATATASAAVEVSSVGSADISSTRLYEGWVDVPGLGDEAVWVPVSSNLTVADKSKNKFVRVSVHGIGTKDERLEIAKAIAELALPKL